MAFDYHVFFVDRRGDRVRRWNPDSGEITTVGRDDDLPRYHPDRLRDPYALAVGPDRTLHVSDKTNSRICSLRQNSWSPIETWDASGDRQTSPGWSRHHPANPTGIWALADGSMIACYEFDHTIYRIAPDGALERLLGMPAVHRRTFGYRERIPLPEAMDHPLHCPTNIVRTEAGRFYFIERYWQNVREFDPKLGLRALFSLRTSYRYVRPDLASDAIDCATFQPGFPTGLALGCDGCLFVGDAMLQRVYRIDPARGTGEVIYATSGESHESGPGALAMGPDGVLWVLDHGLQQLIGLRPRGRGRWDIVPQRCSVAPTDKWSMPGLQGSGMVCA